MRYVRRCLESSNVDSVMNPWLLDKGEGAISQIPSSEVCPLFVRLLCIIYRALYGSFPYTRVELYLYSSSFVSISRLTTIE